ncbi:hypothetical protein, partial [Mesorhizobium sp. M0772]|uniref:hypothetical protein n=1 Tax=Mesorhizobium sp. M0772 TaxID=2956998 RepID=UPI003335D2EC
CAKISMPCDIAGANHHESASFSPCQSYLSAYAQQGQPFPSGRIVICSDFSIRSLSVPISAPSDGADHDDAIHKVASTA